MSVIEYVVSEDNLHSDSPILWDKLEDSISYLDRCINGDGNLKETIGFSSDDIGYFDSISIVQDKIKEAKENFTKMKNCYAYNGIAE